MRKWLLLCLSGSGMAEDLWVLRSSAGGVLPISLGLPWPATFGLSLAGRFYVGGPVGGVIWN